MERIKKLLYLTIIAFLFSIMVSPIADTYYPTPLPKYTIALSAPTVSDDFLFTITQEAVQLTSVQGILQGVGTVTGTVDICDSDGENCSAVEPAMTFDGNQDSYSDLDSPDVTLGETLRWRTETVSGSPFILIVINYMVM